MLPTRIRDKKMGIVGKWKMGTGGHIIYEFFDSGVLQVYTTADRSKDIIGRYSIVGEGQLRLSTPVSDNILGFSIYGNTLKLYPNDGGNPLEFEQIIEKSHNNPQPSDHRTSSSVPGVDSLLKRGCLFLEDSEWEQANEYFDKVLDIAPEYAPAYLGKLCADLQLQKEEMLAKNEKPLTEYKHYKKAIRFANANYKAYLENLDPEYNYKRFLAEMSTAKTEKEYQYLTKQFRKIKKYKNSTELASQCEKAASQCGKAAKKSLDKVKKRRYNILVNSINEAKTEKEYQYLARQFRQMKDYENSIELAKKCENQYSVLKEQRYKEEQRIREESIEEERRRIEQSRRWKEQGLCRYDGGKFVGFLSKKCEFCGRPR